MDMKFNSFKEAVEKQFTNMIIGNDRLFLTDVEKNDLWKKYLESYPEGSNPIYKERGYYDCNACKQFIRPFGNVVSIVNNKLISVWDIEGLEHPFNMVAEKMSEFVKSSAIKNVFVSKERKLGIDKNRQMLKDGTVITWEHFYFELPKSFVDKSSKSVESVQGNYRDNKNVFKRSMDELTIEAGQTILELIDQKSIYRGEEHRKSVESFLMFKSKYDETSEDERDNWCWKNSFNNPVCRIKNNAIGTLLVDLSNNEDIDISVTKFEKIMAPANYKRPKPVFTKKMIEDAQSKIKELGYENSLERRFARLDDITVNNLIFVNRDAKKKLKDSDSVFDELKEEVSTVDMKKYNKVDEVSIEDFIKNILPKITSLELMIENKHSNNFMSLIAPQDKNVPSMFKWNNNFSWSYNGDIADSDIKKNVKNAGGNVQGVLRFSIQWNTCEYNGNDFDAHCVEPSGNLIYFSRMCNLSTTGQLDVDIISPQQGKPAVENIVWTDKSKMQEGIYKFLVHNYSHRGGRDGFSAEIEYDGQIYSFVYPMELKQDEKVTVAEIKFNRETGIEFIKSLDSSVSSREIWGINTNKFTKVNVVMFSPNYWDEQKGIGNKHYLFLLDGCKNETTPRGFFNEFLNEKLTEHRKVFEALGSKMRVKDSDEQLSGVGFSSTQKSSIIAKVEGTFKRVIKIIF